MSYDIIYEWNLKYDTSDHTYKTETDADSETYGYQSRVEEEREVKQIGVSRHILLYIK